MMSPMTPRLGAAVRPCAPAPVARGILALALLVSLLGCGILLASTARAAGRASDAPADSAAAADTTMAPHRVLAYYFHTTQRCASCRKIEAYTKEAIEDGFPEERKDGRLVFRVVNVEEKGNEHFVQDYRLFTKSVVLVDERSGKQAAWKNLAKVWELLNTKEKFVRYVQEETRAYLSGNQP